MKLDKLQKFWAGRLFTMPSHEKRQIANLLYQIFEAAQKGDVFAKQLLGDYSFYGKNRLMQAYALGLLYHAVTPEDRELVFYFKRHIDLLDDPLYKRAQE